MTLGNAHAVERGHLVRRDRTPVEVVDASDAAHAQLRPTIERAVPMGVPCGTSTRSVRNDSGTGARVPTMRTVAGSHKP
jgi:hypothetical protein